MSRRGEARKQQVARWVRALPGADAARDRVLPALRGNATLTDVVWRVFMPQHGAGTLPVPLLPGRHLSGPGVLYLPVVGIVATGLSRAEADALVEEVARLQQQERSFRPVLVLDQPAFPAARGHGFVLEVVVPEEAWADQPGSGSTTWIDYLGRRLAGIVDSYQLWHLARAGRDGIDPLDLAVIRSLADRLPPTLDVSPGS